MVRRLGHRPALDAVRALAIAGVIGLHAIARLFPGGFYGVDIFFVLSAFLITSLILEEVDDSRGRYDFMSFYARRALRLGPALIVFLVVIALPTAVAVHESSSIPLSTAAALFYFGDFALVAGARIGSAYTHIWSLAIEEQFYALWPALLVAFTMRKRQWLRPFLLLLVASSVIIAVVSDKIVGGSYFLPTGHLIPIALGALSAHLFLHGLPDKAEHVVGSGAVGLSCVGFFVAVICGYRAPSNVYEGVGLQILVALAAATLILHLCVSTSGRVARVASTPLPVWVGRRSYGLYLFHRTLAILIPAVFAGIALRYAAPLVLLLSLIVAEASFRFIERPINQAGRAWLRQRHRRGVREAESDLPVMGGPEMSQAAPGAQPAQ
jgi:peptidoglycan/LPS O-acetylase OafA/YrhL